MLPVQHRLRQKKDFQKLFRHGKPYFSRFFTLKIRPNQLPETRFAFIVSNKVTKKAVERNRLKRQLRHIILLRLKQIQQGFDAVVIARSIAQGQSADVLGRETDYLLRKARLLIQNKKP